jgi:hypothetical protein
MQGPSGVVHRPGFRVAGTAGGAGGSLLDSIPASQVRPRPGLCMRTCVPARACMRPCVCVWLGGACLLLAIRQPTPAAALLGLRPRPRPRSATRA